MQNECLSDSQWSSLCSIHGLLPGRKGHVGCRSKMDTRLFIDALLYHNRHGAPWRCLPESLNENYFS
jgi:transposase